MARLLAVVLLLLPLSAQAQDFVAVHDRAEFLSLVKGRALRIAAFGLELRVAPDGQIGGKAMGRPVSGTWVWQDGHFCREMLWGKREIAWNCQLVEARGTAEMRFTVDRGAGQSARFRLE
ncbi:dihydrodipicolinate reductase [Neotabrizicola sp. VNH66]|uniref:dihydrodipicolinate reductase n=1 Tax=Neotabrizicola sp. VNH66 TaxID=3400918 RepID=UPI003C0CF8AB